MWPVQPDESASTATLERYGITSPRLEEGYAAALQIAVQAFAAPFAGIGIRDGEQISYLARHNYASPKSPPGPSLSDRVIRSGSLLVVADALDLPDHAAYASVSTYPRIRFYAGAPLTLASGETIGCLTIGDTAPRHDFDAGRQAMLSALERALPRP